MKKKSKKKYIMNKTRSIATAGTTIQTGMAPNNEKVTVQNSYNSNVHSRAEDRLRNNNNYL